MLKHFLTVLVFVSMVQPCPEPANYNYATLEEEISLAGAIARGRVVDVIGDVNNASVRLADVVFYRGQGPSSIVVEGFKNDVQCGTGVPPLGIDIYVFLCRDDGAWYLNEIAYYTGAISANDKNDGIVDKELPNAWLSESSTQLRYKRCRKRGEEPIGGDGSGSGSSNFGDRPTSITIQNQSSSARESFESSIRRFRESAQSSSSGQFTG